MVPPGVGNRSGSISHRRLGLRGLTTTIGGSIALTIGGSIALIVLGAILAFAVELDVAGVDLNTVGLILMLGGAAGLILGLVSYRRWPCLLPTVPFGKASR